MRHVGRAVEQSVDAVAAICPNDTAVLLLCHLLDDVTELADENTWLHSLDSLVKALARCLYDAHILGVSLGLVADVVRLVEVGMVSFVVEGNVDVEDVTVKQEALIGDTVADDLVGRSTAGLWKVVVVQG